MQRKIVFVFAAAALLGGAALASEAQAGPYMRDGGGRPGATGPVINYKYRLSLLKIQFGAIEDRDKQRGASPILRGSTFVAMMQAANLREGNYVVACTG